MDSPFSEFVGARFLLYGYLKSRVYNTLSCTTKDLKRRIADEIAGINEDLLREVMRDFT